MDKEQKKRLIGEALVGGSTFLGKADRFFSRFGAFIIIFIFGNSPKRHEREGNHGDQAPFFG